MSLAAGIARAFFAISLRDAAPEVASHLRTLLVDAVACILAGANSDITGIAAKAETETGQATVIPGGNQVSARSAAIINGTSLRSLDLMDIYVAADVSHPAESIPAALACAEENGVTGREFLDTVLAACTLHTHLAQHLPLHRNGLHHVGHAAWTVPLVAARLAGRDEDHAANALNLCASAIIVPEGFCRGHVANVKGMAFPLIAGRAIECDRLSAAGLRSQPDACDEVAELLGRIMDRQLDAGQLVPPADPAGITGITLKSYPAQYALQPLIAAAAAFHADAPGKTAEIRNVKVRVARQTAQRTADAAKFRPAGQEAADHSLPFCVACGLLDGGLALESLHDERWKDEDIQRLMDCIEVEAVGDDDGFAVGQQEILLTFNDGSSASLDCNYPGEDRSWRDIAVEKLKSVAPVQADELVNTIEDLDQEDTVRPLVAAICGREMARKKAS